MLTGRVLKVPCIFTALHILSNSSYATDVGRYQALPTIHIHVPGEPGNEAI